MNERELKFRVWAVNDKNPNGKLYYTAKDTPFLLNLNGDLIESFPKDEITLYGLYFARVGNSNLHIQQFTGLKDKNGREIYEGDILKIKGLDYTQDGNYSVSYDFYAFGCVTKDTSGLSEFIWLSHLKNAVEIEIIGNIFENPELLNEK